MDEIHIARLALKLSGLTEPQGRRLAMLITQGLAAGRIDPDVSAEQPAIRVSVTDTPTSDLDRLSGRVVNEVLRQIATFV